MRTHNAHDRQSRDLEREERGATILGIVLAFVLAAIVAVSVYVIGRV